jgi:hypothetical protein
MRRTHFDLGAGMDRITTMSRRALGETATPSDREDIAEALRRRIELYCCHLHTGVPGLRAIGYMRQVAEDEDSLAKLTRVPDRAKSPWLDE